MPCRVKLPSNMTASGIPLWTPQQNLQKKANSSIDHLMLYSGPVNQLIKMNEANRFPSRKPNTKLKRTNMVEEKPKSAFSKLLPTASCKISTFGLSINNTCDFRTFSGRGKHFSYSIILCHWQCYFWWYFSYEILVSGTFDLSF